MCEGLDEKVAAALTQSIVVLAILASLGQEGHPDLSHRVTTGLLPVNRKDRHGDKNVTRPLSQTNFDNSASRISVTF